MKFPLQQELSNENVSLRPLRKTDFENLFLLASDPEVWSQHPNKERYKKENFEIFFTGAMESNGAFVILDKPTNTIIGCTRFYDFNEVDKRIFIGYTFYGKKYWGKNYNSQVKKLMLDYIFQFVNVVDFHVGKENFRSQKAMLKLNAENLGEIEIAYFGENPKLNICYQITKEAYINSQKLQ